MSRVKGCRTKMFSAACSLQSRHCQALALLPPSRASVVAPGVIPMGDTAAGQGLLQPHLFQLQEMEPEMQEVNTGAQSQRLSWVRDVYGALGESCATAWLGDHHQLATRQPCTQPRAPLDLGTGRQPVERACPALAAPGVMFFPWPLLERLLP